MSEPVKYKRLAKDILSEILTSTYQNGKLPPMVKLAELHQVSLMTASRAVKKLEELGLVKCGAGKSGTLIISDAVSRWKNREAMNHPWVSTHNYMNNDVELCFIPENYSDKDESCWSKIFASFNKQYPWINVVLPSNHKKLLENNDFSKADVVQVVGRNMPQMIKHGEFINLTELVNKSDDLTLDNIFPVALSHCRIDDSIYGLPHTINTPMLFFNKELLGKASASPSFTWRSLCDCANGAKSNKKGVCLNVGIGTFLYYFIGDLKIAVSRSDVESPLREALETMKKLFRDTNPNGSSGSGMVDRFIDGEIAFLVSYSSIYHDLKERCGFDLGITSMPCAADGETIVETASTCICEHSRAKPESWLFCKFLNSPEIHRKLMENGVIHSAQRSVFDEALKHDRDFREIFSHIITKAIPTTVSDYALYRFYRSIFPELTRFLGGKSVVEDIQPRFKSTLKEMIELENFF